MDAAARGPQRISCAIGVTADEGLFRGLPESMRRWCLEQHVSQSTLAMRVGVSASHLNQIILGHVRPSAELAHRIRTAIGPRARWPERVAALARGGGAQP